MDAKTYFDEVVEPMISELKERSNERALIMASAIVTFHATDWIAEERNEEKVDVRRRILKRFPDFKYLQALANAHKHKKVDSPAEFRGLTDPLSAVELIPTVRQGHPIRSEVERVIVHIPPKYIFGDGTEHDPLVLLTNSAQAILKEFDAPNSAKE